MPDPTLIIEPGSPGHAICVFFRNNPDEFLDRPALSAKLRIAPGAVDAAMLPVVEAGLVTMANDGDLGRVWRPGPRLKHWILLASPPPVSKPAVRRGGTRTYLPPINAGSVGVVSGAPLPNHIDRFAMRGRTKYDALFDKLVEDDQSLQGLPIAYKAAMQKAVTVYLKQRPRLTAHSHLRVLRIDDKTCGVWRTARPGKP